ncbi:hypothetical protein BH24ACI3_BH24ACI3_11620 [soil metagenome]
MKICPTCRRTYPEDDLNFCLEDGTVLRFASSELPETIMIQQPNFTSPNTAPPTQGVAAGWDNKPQYSLQPPRSSRSWLWIVGILGIGLLLCGGGLAGLFIIGVMVPDEDQVESGNNVPKPPPADEAISVEKVDLSEWVRDTSEFGTTEFRDGEFYMAARQKGFYYVLVAPKAYSTENARASVKLRNVDNADSKLGYGLIFLSEPTPLTKGYAFLIDTKTRRFRVVHHEPKKENVIAKRERSTSIRSGAAENQLEARHKDGIIELLINGQVATSIRNGHGAKNGVAGIYSGDGARIAFKELEIRK